MLTYVFAHLFTYIHMFVRQVLELIPLDAMHLWAFCCVFAETACSSPDALVRLPDVSVQFVHDFRIILTHFALCFPNFPIRIIQQLSFQRMCLVFICLLKQHINMSRKWCDRNPYWQFVQPEVEQERLPVTTNTGGDK